MTIERELARYKRGVDQRWGELVYDGQWYSPLKRALDTFIDEAQRAVSGEIRMVLHGGKATVTGRKSEVGLYDFNLATYDAGDSFDHPRPGLIEITACRALAPRREPACSSGINARTGRSGRRFDAGPG